MSLGYCIITILVGGLIPVQAAINSHLRTWLGNPMHATFVSLMVSCICVVAYLCIFREPVADMNTITAVPWWAWLGGVCGVVYLFTVTVMAPRLGAAPLIACIIGGQVIFSMVLDQFGWLGFATHPISAQRIGGSVLLMLGVALILKS